MLAGGARPRGRVRAVAAMAAAGLRGCGGRALTVVALRLALLLGATLGPAWATVYFQEQFLDGGWARAAEGVEGVVGQLPVTAV